ncbi:hypothetical protein METHB2_340039 [Candidatus Methylobacter favarea]|uniref:TubC N-terminal docking domain-containing protein n=1 Tax=Candidatus Methylobacter favarea TaxID=2707345 RepID=A0A8S0YA53_9GAMM|nr:hypothetical protein [Candidatus Methylobacter favarea]CAA9891121.1 hypothetical protein METHB2_340039 [Candidatus Methylobacter favarea]
MSLLEKMRIKGFTVALSDDDFNVTPYEQLDKPQLEFLKSHRTEIMRELRQEQSANDDYHYCDFEWESPNDIESQLPAVQSLQAEMIPEPFRAWLADVSHRMQTPGDFAAVSSIVIVGSLIGAGCSIKPKRLDDWEVIPNVWGACIGRPSTTNRK